MDAVLRISISEDTRQTGYRAVDRHRSVTAPHNIFSLLAESAFLRTGVPLSHTGSSPDPSCPLEGIGDGRVLSPVNKEADRSPFLAGFPHIIQPFSHPVCPGSLVFVISIKIRKCICSTHTAVFLVCSTVSSFCFVPPDAYGGSVITASKIPGWNALTSFNVSPCNIFQFFPSAYSSGYVPLFHKFFQTQVICHRHHPFFSQRSG